MECPLSADLVTTELGRVVGGGNEEGGISMRCCGEE